MIPPFLSLGPKSALDLAPVAQPGKPATRAARHRFPGAPLCPQCSSFILERSAGPLPGMGRARGQGTFAWQSGSSQSNDTEAAADRRPELVRGLGTTIARGRGGWGGPWELCNCAAQLPAGVRPASDRGSLRGCAHGANRQWTPGGVPRLPMRGTARSPHRR